MVYYVSKWQLSVFTGPKGCTSVTYVEKKTPARGEIHQGDTQ